MCGILGLAGPDIARWSAAFEPALTLMAHRGPDGSGVWTSTDGQVRLGHRRLAILDLSQRGAQPMADGGGNLVVTFNGEIYNYLELRTELQGLGHVFSTRTDTETLLAAYAEWGTGCLSRFNGMFAFALYDARARRLFCARDRFGEKPFLFFADEGRFAFASEIKALLMVLGYVPAVDEVRLVRAAYRAGAALDGERETIFRGVQQLLPGEALDLDVRVGARRIWRYWDPVDGGECAPRTQGEAAERLRWLLKDAVRLRLRSDVALGSCLSGGLDSGAIACLVRELIGPDRPYHTFTGRFPGTPADEWDYARELIAATDAHSHCVTPTPERLVDELPRFVWHNELPVGSTSQFAQWCVFALAKQAGVVVLLDGQGADEILAGYEQYFGPYTQSLAELGDTDRLGTELPLIRRRYPLGLSPATRTLRDRLPWGLRRWLAHRLGRGGNLLFGVRSEVARAVLAAEGAVEPSHPALTSGLTSLGRALYRDSFCGSLSALLRYGDRNSMAHSREVRLPFCDHRIAELAFGLHPWHLMGEAQTKRLLREAMRGILPERIRTRWNKQGFLPPQGLWLRTPQFLALASDMLGTADFRTSGLWLPGWWQRLLERVRRGEGQLAWTLWHPLMAELWREHFLRRIAAEVRGGRA